MCSSDVLIKLIDFWTHPEHFMNTFWTCSVFYIFAHVLLNVLICSKQNTSAILVFWICSRSVLWTSYVFRTCSNDVLMKSIALWTHHEHILNMFWTRHMFCTFAVQIWWLYHLHCSTHLGIWNAQLLWCHLHHQRKHLALGCCAIQLTKFQFSCNSSSNPVC